MAVYTTEVRTICKQQYLNAVEWKAPEPMPTFPDVDTMLTLVATDVLPFSMPQNPYINRQSVAVAILKHYWMREIGMETVALWQYSLCTRLSEIMPKYIEIAKAQADMGSIWETENRKLVHSGEFGTSRGETGSDSRDKSGTTGNTRDTTGLETGENGKTITRNVDESETTKKDSTIGDKGTKAVDTTNKDILTGSHEGTIAVSQTQTNDLNQTVKETQSGTTDTTQKDTGTSNKDGDSGDKFSDTPQDGLATVLEGKYLTSYRNIQDTEQVLTSADQAVNAATESSQDTVKDDTGTVKVVTDTRDGGSDSKTDTFVGNVKETSGNDRTGTESGTRTNGTVDDAEEHGTDSRQTTGKITDDGSHSDTESGQYKKDGTESGTDSHTDTWVGYQGDKAKSLYDYNQYYINIYQMIIGEVASFFMGILG